MILARPLCDALIVPLHALQLALNLGSSYDVSDVSRSLSHTG
jgi:hypothetical protein